MSTSSVWDSVRGSGPGAPSWSLQANRETWVCVNFGSWCWTGRPGVLRFTGSQRVGHDWATELNWRRQQFTAHYKEESNMYNDQRRKLTSYRGREEKIHPTYWKRHHGGRNWKTLNTISEGDGSHWMYTGRGGPMGTVLSRKAIASCVK